MRSTIRSTTVVLIGMVLSNVALAGGVARNGARHDMGRPSVSQTGRTVLASVTLRARRTGDEQGADIGTTTDHERVGLKQLAATEGTAAFYSPLAGVPVNDMCANATPISGAGVFNFDNSTATLDGPSHAGCVDSLDSEGTLDHDIWYCWTSPCSGPVDITTCDNTGVDTKIAVYGSCQNAVGAPNCPPADDDLFPFGCNDDAEGGDRCGLQSGVTILAEAGKSYLIRVGTYPGDASISQPPAPGGAGSFSITCVDTPCENNSTDEKCQVFHRFSGTGSDGSDFRVADDFMATETGVITDVCWWGSYLGDIWAPGTWPDTFEVRYYADSGGLPGALIGGPFKQLDGTLSVRPAIDTGVGESFRVFEHTAVHGGTCSVSGTQCDVWGAPCRNVCAIGGQECTTNLDCTEPDDTCTVSQTCDPVGVSVTAGGRYWIEIVNDTYPNSWFWQDGIGGDLASLQDGYLACAISNEPCSSDRDCTQAGDSCSVIVPANGYDAGDMITYDMAFCLDVTNESSNPSPCATATGECCTGAPNGTPGCQDPTCCALVCACDPFCCSPSGWDDYCQGNGFGDTGCGAAVLCADVCLGCPDGTVAWLDPLVDPVRHPDGLVDARQPWPIGDPATQQGFQTFFVEAPIDASTETIDGCWTLCETGDNGTPNQIADIASGGDGTYTITLQRPITPGQLTTLAYTSDTGVVVSEKFAALPGDANANRLVNTGDINHLIDCLNLVTPEPCDEWQTDINHSGLTNAQDILRLIDLLNGAGSYDVWITKSVGTDCPAP